MRKKMMLFLLCVALIVSYVNASVIEVEAFAPAIALEGQAVWSAYLSACGYSSFSAAEAQSSWESLTAAQQAAFVTAGENAEKIEGSKIGMAKVSLSDVLTDEDIQEINEFVYNHYYGGLGTFL